MKQLDIPSVFTLAWFCDARQASREKGFKKEPCFKKETGWDEFQMGLRSPGLSGPDLILVKMSLLKMSKISHGGDFWAWVNQSFNTYCSYSNSYSWLIYAWYKWRMQIFTHAQKKNPTKSTPAQNQNNPDLGAC